MDLKEKLEKRLLGSKFRLLNDKLYKNKQLKDSDMEHYHKYYEEQIKKWPLNPLDKIIKRIEETNEEAIIADLGCGTAKIATVFKNVYSFDSYPQNDKTMKCDISQTPLMDNSVDVVVCCLSLMMNYISKVIKETNRILKKDGVFYLAEVKSRICSVNYLCKQLESLNFKIVSCDTSSNYFVLIEVRKIENFDKKKLPKILLKPCSYKKR